MIKYKINSKKQDNGLWGMPLNVSFYSGVQKDYELEISAIIIYISELYPYVNFHVKLYNSYINVEIKNDFSLINCGIPKLIRYYYKNIKVHDDILIILETEEDFTKYNRLIKIRNIYADI